MRTTTLDRVGVGTGPDYGGRKTRPDYFNAYAGGIGIVPRRGWDERTALLMAETASSPVRAVRAWSQNAPLVLLSALIDAHPTAQMALSNDLALAFGPEDTTFVAIERGRGADGTPTETVVPEGTGIIADFWATLPSDIGGIMGLQWTLADQASRYGMACLEGVLGNTESGVINAATYSPLSVRFRDTDSGRIAEQLQRSGTPVELPPLTCFNAAWRGNADNPYGAPRFGAFLGEGLADVGSNKDLRDWKHTIALPRLSVTFPYNAVVQYAMENPSKLRGIGPGGRDMTPTEYADRQFGLFSQKLEDMKTDDILMLAFGADAKGIAIPVSDALPQILAMDRLRLIQSLDHFANMVGVTDGGTQAYATEQARAYYKKLEALRSWVNAIIIRLLNLHLRSLGVNLVAKAETQPIQPKDRQAEANAQEVEIRNETALADRGYQTDDDAATHLTGSAVVDPARAEAAANRANNPAPVAVPDKKTGKGGTKAADPAASNANNDATMSRTRFGWKGIKPKWPF